MPSYMCALSQAVASCLRSCCLLFACFCLLLASLATLLRLSWALVVLPDASLAPFPTWTHLMTSRNYFGLPRKPSRPRLSE